MAAALWVAIQVGAKKGKGGVKYQKGKRKIKELNAKYRVKKKKNKSGY